MRYILSILLLFPLLLQAQYELKPDVKPMFRTIYAPLSTVAFDSTTLERYLVTNTFLLDNGVVVALVDTITTDTLRVYITGSDQPTPVTSMSSVQLDTSFQIGSAGVQFDSIVLVGGEVRWYSGGRYFDIGKVIYTTPNAPTTLTVTSTESDTLTYLVNDFSSPADGTVSDSCMVRWDTVAIPTTITAGNLVYRGDTNVASTKFFIDMDDSLEVYVSAFSKNDTGTAIGAWSIARSDSVWIDNTDPGYVVLDTLGWVGVGGLTSTGTELRSYRDTAEASGTVDTIWVYMGGESTNDSIIVAIYGDDTNYPGALLGTSLITVANAGANAYIGIALTSSVSITSGQVYWLKWESKTGITMYYASNAARLRIVRSHTWDGTSPDPFPVGGSSGNYEHSMYAKVKQ